MVRQADPATLAPRSVPESLVHPGRLSTIEHDTDQPYERVAELTAERPRSSSSGIACTEARHRKRTPAVIAYRLSAVDGERVLVQPYVVGACVKHRRELEREISVRQQRFARGGAEAIAEVVIE